MHSNVSERMFGKIQFTKMRTVRNGRFSTDDFNLMAHLYHF